MTPSKTSSISGTDPRSAEPRRLSSDTITRGVRQLTAVKINAFLAEADRIGLDLCWALQSQGISRDMFEDPHRSVGRDQATAAFEVIAAAAPADFALNLGARWTFQEFGLVGYGLLSCRTYGEFTDRWLDHIEFIGLPLAFRSVVRADGWSLEMRPRIALSPRALRMCVEEACASVFPLHRELCGGAGMAGTRVELTDINIQRDLVAAASLDAKVQSGMPVNRLVMRTAERFATIQIAEPMLRGFVNRHCGTILPEIAGRDDLIGGMRHHMLLSRGLPPDLAASAAVLGTSKRTLNRNLARGGWTHAGLVDRYRHDYALALLRSRELCAKEISFMLHFENPSSFRRAFRRWTGQSVGQWARQELGRLPKRR